MDEGHKKQLAAMRRQIIISSILTVVLITVLVVPRYAAGTASWLHHVLVAGVVLSFAYPMYRKYRSRKQLRELMRCDWRRCRWCSFDLAGLADSGKCPECGEAYSIDEVRQWWKDVMEAELGPNKDISGTKST